MMIVASIGWFPAHAQTSKTIVVTAKPDAAAEPDSAKTGPNRIICRYQQQLGSRLIGHRACLRAIEWEQIAIDNRFLHEHLTTPITMSPAG